MANIYELTESMIALKDMGEDPNIDPLVLKDTMEAVEGEFEDKAEAYAKVMTELTAEAEAIKQEITRLMVKKNALEANVKRMKNILKNSMKTTGKVKFKTNLFSFYVKKNPPTLVIDSAKDIPLNFFIPQDPVIDTAGIKEDLKNGAKYDFAHLEQGDTVIIK